MPLRQKNLSDHEIAEAHSYVTETTVKTQKSLSGWVINSSRRGRGGMKMSHAVTREHSKRSRSPNPAVGIAGVLEKTEKQVDKRWEVLNKTL